MLEANERQTIVSTGGTGRRSHLWRAVSERMCAV